MTVRLIFLNKDGSDVRESEMMVHLFDSSLVDCPFMLIPGISESKEENLANFLIVGGSLSKGKSVLKPCFFDDIIIKWFGA